MTRAINLDARLAYAGRWDALGTSHERLDTFTRFLRVLREANFDREEPGWFERGRHGEGVLIRHPFTHGTSALLDQETRHA